MPKSSFTIAELASPLNQFISVTGGLVPRGFYNENTNYAVGDCVAFEGSSYLMFNDGPAGTAPDNETYWQPL
ncbi:hypothetical protein A2375_02025 [Candidatus Woesebacteria bacterium RIFOXYB1_FULL_31_120]|nr:MAG: hypothetical protein A2375_02025 [Candidatus Woesebacteria bacterium RIFOXYB1_FULL_31_120]